MSAKVVTGAAVFLLLGGGVLTAYEALAPGRVLGTASPRVFAEKIPSSRFHGPDGTWWGYNQSKIARVGNRVYSYVIENRDSSSATVSKFTILKKEGDGAWERGASFTTSRPGNILVDSKGVLHTFVFEPTDARKNDSWGRLLHYWFPTPGDISNFKKETIVANDGTSETANIRVGAAISSDDTMVVAFGLTKNNPHYSGHSVHAYTKKPTGKGWTHLIPGQNVGHDFYYPFVATAAGQIHLLPIQDDFVGTNKPNIYQKIHYWRYGAGSWQRENIVDHTKHALASSRPRLLEQDDLFVDSRGITHILYKETTAANPQTTTHYHLSGQLGAWHKQPVFPGRTNINWLRLLDVNGTLYYVAATWDTVYLSRVDSERLVAIPLPFTMRGAYPYVATKKSQNQPTDMVDILLLSGAQSSYTDGSDTSLYLRISHSEFSKLP